MSPQQLERVRTVLAAAVEVPMEDRSAFVRSHCAGDETLLAEVEALLSLHGSAGEFLTHSLPELLGATGDARCELTAGTVLKNRYRIERRIDQSSFTTVYLASDELLDDMSVIVKVLDQVSDAAVVQAMFVSELQSLSRIRHPNVIGISDVGSLDSGPPFLVLEYVPGLTLREILRAGPVPGSRARAILQALGRALSAAHRAEVCHLDIKPENVIVSEPGTAEERVRLIDFGIARLKTICSVSHVAGSRNYMAPEQEESPSSQCDIYAFSLLAFELFTGHRPRDGQEIKSQLPRGLGRRSIEAIVKGLDPLPAKRFGTVSDCVEELAAPSRRGWLPYTTGAAAAVGVAAISYFWFNQTQCEYSTPLPILASSSIERQPAISPNGLEIYYTVGEIGRQDIYKKVLGTGLLLPVVTSPAHDEQPQVSPDGKNLMFIRGIENAEMVQLNLASGREEILTAGVDVDTYSWSPDGRRIVFSGVSNGRQKVQVLDTRTKRIRALEIRGVSDCGLFHPSMSPDGRFLAFACRWSQGSDDLFVGQINENLEPVGSARRVTHRQDRIVSVEWTPDSKTVLYVGGPLGGGSVWRVDPSGTASPVRVAVIPGQVESIAVARREWKLAYSRQLPGVSIWQSNLESTLPPTRLLSSIHGDGEGYLSPDGQKLLFASGRSGSLQEWIAEANGTNARQLTNFEGADVVTATWTPNSRDAIISVRSKDVGERIYQTPVYGTATLTRLLDGAMATAVSHDGKWLYVTKATERTRSIWRTQLAKSVTMELIADGGVFGLESPERKSFYFAKRDEREGLWHQPLPSGPTTRVVARLHRRNLFAIGKTGIFYIAPIPVADYPALFFKGFQDQASRILLKFQRQIEWGLSLSPDERSIIFSQTDAGNSDILLIERFR
jgi:serine/threonine protein kinase/WD40 repeat protein